MQQGFRFQILLLLAPILASSAFTTICSDRATRPTWAGKNNVQVMQQAPRISPSIHSTPFYCGQRSYSSPSSFLQLAAESDDEASSLEGEGEVEASETVIDPKWKRVLFFYKYNKDGSLKAKEDDDGLTFRQKLAKMGLSVLLSYGFVSNMSYCVTVSLA